GLVDNLLQLLLREIPLIRFFRITQIQLPSHPSLPSENQLENANDIENCLAAQFVFFEQLTILLALLKRGSLEVGHKLLHSRFVNGIQRQAAKPWKNVFGQMVFHAEN